MDYHVVNESRFSLGGQKFSALTNDNLGKGLSLHTKLSDPSGGSLSPVSVA